MNQPINGRRFEGNFGILNQADMVRLQSMSVMIVGMGGLGGHVAASMVRLGVIRLTLVDPDVFDETNLNRQLFCDESTIGLRKVSVASESLLRINSNLIITTRETTVQHLDKADLHPIDLIVDAVDDIATKRYLERLGTTLGIPVLHGACAGWYGQVAWLEPGSTLLHLYYGDTSIGVETSLRNPSFTPAVVANVMISEFVKHLQNAEENHHRGLLLIDLANDTMERILTEERE